MAINIQIIKKILADIKKKLDVVLLVDFKTSLEFFESGLNALQNGLYRTSTENMREARKEALKALAIYKMKENQVKNLSYTYSKIMLSLEN
jgi:hypothetical protein